MPERACGGQRASLGASPVCPLCLRQDASFSGLYCVCCQAVDPCVMCFWSSSCPHLASLCKSVGVTDVLCCARLLHRFEGFKLISPSCTESSLAIKQPPQVFFLNQTKENKIFNHLSSPTSIFKSHSLIWEPLRVLILYRWASYLNLVVSY